MLECMYKQLIVDNSYVIRDFLMILKFLNIDNYDFFMGLWKIRIRSGFFNISHGCINFSPSTPNHDLG